MKEFLVTAGSFREEGDERSEAMPTWAEFAHIDQIASQRECWEKRRN